MGVALVLFLGTVGSGFVWDDELLFRSWLPYFDGPRAVLSPPPGIPNYMYQYYRPVLTASYLLDERLATAAFAPESRQAGRRVFFHLTPVLLHVGCTGLVFVLGTMLLGGKREDDGPWIAFAAALLFAVHPIHVESVAWIVGRSDSLCTLAGLASLIALLHWRTEGRLRSLVAAAVLLLVAMLTKEIGIGLLLPACVIACSWPSGDKTRRMRVYEVSALVVLLASYGGLRAASSAQVAAPVEYAGLIGRLLGAFGWYAVKVVWPFPQTAFPAAQLTMPYVVSGLVAAGLAAVACVFWRRSEWQAERVALAVALGGCGVSLLVAVTNVATSPVAERNLYLPSAGVCLLAALLVNRIARGRMLRATAIPAVALLAGLLAIPAGYASSRRLRVWDDPALFWSEAISSAPESAIAHINLGAALAAVGRLPEAEQAYERAILLADAKDQSAMAHANLGSLLLLEGRLDPAIVEFERVLTLNPRDATSQFNWASALNLKAESAAGAERARLLDEATEHLGAALALHPRYGRAHLLLGTILLQGHKLERARSELSAAATLDPGSSEALRAQALLTQMLHGGVGSESN